ncbi:collagen-like protein [bacterium BFN5]|nr:collagen-like protein [bacterium BFN5]
MSHDKDSVISSENVEERHTCHKCHQNFPSGLPLPFCPSCSTNPSDVTAFAYIYNLGSQVVAMEGDIAFSNNGIIVGNITHTVGTAAIVLGTPGYYAIWFHVAGVEANQFTLYQNGLPVTGAIYGSGAVTQPNPGMVIITAASGDVLTLRNHTSATAVTLQALAGGTQLNANASILIQKLNT